MRTMEIGKLNKRITFLRLEDATDEMGQSTKKLQEVKTVWASFYPIRGSEFYEVQKVQSRVSHKCYVRYLDGIDTNCYIRYGGKDYDINSVVDVDLAHKMLEIYCYEHTNKEAIS
jgi:SPP1 family predicted phage head-tail adaptor